MKTNFFPLAGALLALLSACAGSPDGSSPDRGLAQTFAAFRPAPETFTYQADEGKAWVFAGPKGGTLILDPDSLEAAQAAPADLQVKVTSVQNNLEALALGLSTVARTGPDQTAPLISSGMWKVEVRDKQGKPLELKPGKTARFVAKASGDGDRQFVLQDGLWQDEGVQDRVVGSPFDGNDYTRIILRTDKKTALVQFGRTFPGAKFVGWVGDFQGWNMAKAIPFKMTRPSFFEYEQEVPLDFNPTFKFNVDGEWTEDSMALDTKEDGFGGSNSTFKVSNYMDGLSISRDSGAMGAAFLLRKLGIWINCDRYINRAAPTELWVKNPTEPGVQSMIIAVNALVNLPLFLGNDNRGTANLWTGETFRVLTQLPSGKILVSGPIQVTKAGQVIEIEWKPVDLSKIKTEADWKAVLKEI